MSLNHPDTGQAKRLSGTFRKRLSAKRELWVASAPLPDAARRVLLDLSIRAARNTNHNIDVNFTELAAKTEMSAHEACNCVRYLHDICLVTIEGPASVRIRFGAEAEARVRRRLSGGEWAKIRKAVIARDGRHCRYCWAKCSEIEIDHIHPFSRGGSNHIRNLTVSCSSCNNSKAAKTWFEWRFPYGGDAA